MDWFIFSADQFKRTKDGDRFFFTHKGQAGGFTGNALKFIMQRTLGDILCDVTGAQSLPHNVFLVADTMTNPIKPCLSKLTTSGKGREDSDRSDMNEWSIIKMLMQRAPDAPDAKEASRLFENWTWFCHFERFEPFFIVLILIYTIVWPNYDVIMK